MPKVTKISASYARTINVGNFHSVRVESTVEAELEEGELHREALRGLHTMVKSETDAKAVEALDQIKAERDAIFAHAMSEPRKKGY